jgi:hypothetical protein
VGLDFLGGSWNDLQTCEYSGGGARYSSEPARLSLSPREMVEMMPELVLALDRGIHNEWPFLGLRGSFRRDSDVRREMTRCHTRGTALGLLRLPLKRHGQEVERQCC